MITKIITKKQFDGSIQIRAVDDKGETFIIVNGLEVLQDVINLKGYELAREARQGYQRLTINK